MDRKTRDTTRVAPTPIEENSVEARRRPDGAVVPGESPAKRTNDERNDPRAEPGARAGQPRRHSPQR
jgi:hypothetical protein